MSKRIIITRAEDVTLRQAFEAVLVALGADIEKGEAVSLSNGLAVDYRETKTDSFMVWKGDI